VEEVGLVDDDLDVTVECQLCFHRIRSSSAVEHLKGVHNVADAALYNDKPLKSWVKRLNGTYK
jgi:hypothetical protein